MRYGVTFTRVINQLMPHYLGGRKLILFLQAILHPLQTLNDSFAQWGRDKIIEANMTSQIIKFEWYLNYKFSKYFNDSTERISIQNATGVGVALYHEDTSLDITHAVIRQEGESDEADDNIILYNANENVDTNNKSFYVISPAIDSTLISETEYKAMVAYQVDRYKLAGKTYKIKFNNEE